VTKVARVAEVQEVEEVREVREVEKRDSGFRHPDPGLEGEGIETRSGDLESFSWSLMPEA
jgi:hypothetical protein